MRRTRRVGRLGVCAVASLALLAEPVAAAENADVQPPAGSSAGVSAADFHAVDRQLSGLIETLLADNQGIRAAWTRSRAAMQAAPQGRALPDPVLKYRYFASTPETRVGPQVQALEISQGVPWSGKRRSQAERATVLASGTTWEAEDLQRAFVAEVKRAYFEAAYLQEALAVNAEERELLKRFEAIALKRYATGEGIQQNVLKVQTDISRLRAIETDLAQRLKASTRRIAGLTAQPGRDLSLSRIALFVPDLRYDDEELERDAVSTSPRLRALEKRVEADRVWAEGRALQSRPDFRFGVEYGQVKKRTDPQGVTSPPEDNGKDIFALTVGLTIPLHRARNRAGVAEADESRLAHQETLADMRHHLRHEIQEVTLRLDSIGEQSRLYGDVIIPQAEEALASTEAAYTTNRQGFLDLLDAERVLFQVRLVYHRLVADYWIALADLEYGIGRPFPETQSAGGES